MILFWLQIEGPTTIARTHIIARTHKATNKGKDITQELQRIKQKYSETTQAG